MGASMSVKLAQEGPVRFVATNPAGASIVVDGPGAVALSRAAGSAVAFDVETRLP